MKKLITILLLVSLFSLYGCANTEPGAVSSDADTSAPVESTAESTAESTFESTADVTDVVTADTEETAEKTIEDAKTVGEALEILYSEFSFDSDNVFKLFVDSDIYDDKYGSVEDKETLSGVIDTVKNAPLISYEVKEASPGASSPIKFYGEGNTVLFTALVEESCLSLDSGAYILTTEEGYFAELCELIEGLEK